MKNSFIVPLLGIGGILVFFCVTSDFASIFPYTVFFSIPLFINLFLSGAIDRQSAHILNNLSAVLYLALFSTAAATDSYTTAMVLLGTPLGPLLLVLLPSLWIIAWWKRDSENTP